MPTATNPTTGEKVAWINGQWVPVEATATNKSTGERLALVGGEWQPLDYSDVSDGFSFGEMASNIPQSAVKYGKDIASAVTNPVDTARSVGAIAGDVLTGRYGQEVGRAMSGQEPSQGVSGVVHSGVKSRYGTPDAALNTIEQDPVGFLADVAGAGGATNVPRVSRAMAAAEPLNVVGKTGRSVAKTLIPKNKPADLYQKSAKFSKTLPKEKKERMLNTALEREIMPTHKGGEKAIRELKSLNEQFDQIIQSSTKAGGKIPVAEVFNKLQTLRRKSDTFRPGADKDVAAIDKIITEFRGQVDELGRNFVTPEEMQRFKVGAQELINFNRRKGKRPIKEKARDAQRRGAKEAIEKELPEVIPINASRAEILELMEYLPGIANRIEDLNPISLTHPMNVGAGALVGDALGSSKAGAFAGVVASVLNSAKPRARLAIAMNKIKQGDIRWLNANRGAKEVRVALALAGRSQEEINDLLTSQ